MAKSAKISLKLLIDDKRNKVVFAEADQDFVDVLISLLTLPMGKVARLLLNQKMVLGCFKNLNKSLADMSIDHFETEACKTMLLNPKSVFGIHCRRLKLNLSQPDDTNIFVCHKLTNGGSCPKAYSSFNTSRCQCGDLMNSRINVSEEEYVGEVIGDNVDGVFVNCRSSFIVTDDLKVAVSSIGVIMQVLSDQGYTGLTDLRETLLEVGFDEVVTLLGCLLTSETPLTCAFLNKTITTKMNKMLSPLPGKAKGVETPNTSSLCSVKVFVRKLDREILYVECNEDFIDSLVSFLILPLELTFTLSNDNTNLRCVGNLCRSSCRRASASSFHQFPDFYDCKYNAPFKQSTHSSPIYHCRIPSKGCYSWGCTISRQNHSSEGGNIVYLYPNYPKGKPGTTMGDGFMKRNTRFIVSNDLVISPLKSTSMIDLLKKKHLGINDLEEHQISIFKTELINILRASLLSSSALTSGLSNFLTKKVKEET